MTLGMPYSECLDVPCDMVLEIVESKLDEGLSYLEGDRPRLARKQVAAVKAFGSVENMVREAMKRRLGTPDLGEIQQKLNTL